MRFHLTTIRADVPHDYWINRARRDEVPNFLLLWQVAALCVSTDVGEDYKLLEVAQARLSSWIAGGLAVCQISNEGKPVIDAQAVLNMRSYFETTGLWSEGVQRWCGVWQAESALVPLLGVRPVATVFPEVAPSKQLLTRPQIEAQLGAPLDSEDRQVTWKTAWEKILKYFHAEGINKKHGRYEIAVVRQALAEIGYSPKKSDKGAELRVFINRIGRKP